MAEAVTAPELLTTTIVIRAFTEDRFPATCEAIKSAINQSSCANEVLVVIDHNPGLLNQVQDVFSSDSLVRVIPNSRKRGIGGGSNTALLQAKGDLVAFLDDDAVADPEWLASMYTLFDDPDVAGVAGYAFADWIDGPKPKWIPPGFNWVYGCSDNHAASKRKEIRNVWGGNNLMRRQLIIDQGGFLEEGLGRIGSHPIGCEDTELCIRIKQSIPTAKFIYEPTAIIHHKVPSARTTLGYFRSRCYHEGMSKALLAHKLGSQDGLDAERRHAFLILPKVFFGSLGRALTTGSVAEAQRAGAVALGLITATYGLITGGARLRFGLASPLADLETPLR